MRDKDDTTPQLEDETKRLERATQPMDPTKHRIGPYLDSLSNGLTDFANRVREEERLLTDNEDESPLASLLAELGKLAKTVSIIHKNPSEDSDFCLGCIYEFLKRTTSRNAIQLQGFNAGNLCQLSFESTAAKLSSVPLAEHMKRLKSGDRYDVVSDLASWRDDQLGEFARETEAAVKKGVFVRRVFNLMLRHPFDPVTGGEMQTILHQHLKHSQDWNSKYTGKYDVAIFGRPNLERLRTNRPSVVHDAFAIEFHFGIFFRRAGKTLVEYEVRSPDVSAMTLKKDEGDILNHLETFQAVWDVAPKLTDKIGEKTAIEVVLENPKQWTD